MKLKVLLLTIFLLFMGNSNSAVLECDLEKRVLNDFEYSYSNLEYEVSDILVTRGCGRENVVGKIVNVVDGLSGELLFDFRKVEEFYDIYDIQRFDLCVHQNNCMMSVSIDKSILENYGKGYSIDLSYKIRTAYLYGGGGIVDLFSPNKYCFWCFLSKDYRVMYKSLKEISVKDISHLSLSEKEFYDEYGAVSNRYLSLGVTVYDQIFFIYFSVSDAGIDFHKFSTAVI